MPKAIVLARVLGWPFRNIRGADTPMIMWIKMICTMWTLSLYRVSKNPMLTAVFFLLWIRSQWPLGLRAWADWNEDPSQLTGRWPSYVHSSSYVPKGLDLAVAPTAGLCPNHRHGCAGNISIPFNDMG